MALKLDHIIYATADLDACSAELGDRLGVGFAPGGQHLGIGTHNQLLSLGDGVYLEIIGPDPSQPEPPRPRPFGIEDLDGQAGRLASFACKASGLVDVVADARAKGYDPSDPFEMSRDTPDGRTLRWSLAMHHEGSGDGLIPSLIDWGDTPSPATTSPTGCSLLGLEAIHPDPDTITAALKILDVDLRVSRGPQPTLIATINSPAGVVELR